MSPLCICQCPGVDIISRTFEIIWAITIQGVMEASNTEASVVVVVHRAANEEAQLTRRLCRWIVSPLSLVFSCHPTGKSQSGSTSVLSLLSRLFHRQLLTPT